MLARHAATPLRTALADRPVVLLHGARQTGKTTLVRAVAKEIEAQYVTLDDLTMLAAAHGDPAGFKQPLLFV
jgi:predicted AAA+ superfamily ATPase